MDLATRIGKYFLEMSACVVCGMIPRPDLDPYICSNRHQFCGPCGGEVELAFNDEKKVSEKPCPLCRGLTFPNLHLPNFIQDMNGMAGENVQFSCVNYVRGCKVTGKDNFNFKEHEKICIYKKITCFYRRCAEEDNKTSLATMGQTHPRCFTILNFLNGSYRCLLKFRQMIDLDLDRLYGGQVFRPKLLSIRDKSLKKRIFLHFDSYGDEGLEVWLEFHGDPSLLPDQYKTMPIIISFVLPSREMKYKTAILELNHQDRYFDQKYILSKDVIMDWSARGLAEKIRHIELNIFFPRV